MAGGGGRSGITKPLWSSRRSNAGGRIERSQDLFHRSRRDQRRTSVCRGCWCCGLLGRRRTQAAIASMWNARAVRTARVWMCRRVVIERWRCLACLLLQVQCC